MMCYLFIVETKKKKKKIPTELQGSWLMIIIAKYISFIWNSYIDGGKNKLKFKFVSIYMCL